MGLPVNPKRGSLTINSVSLTSTRFMARNLAVLHGLGQLRGSDRVIPGVAGVVPLRRRTTATRYDLELYVCGDDDGAGLPFTDVQAGLVSNLNVVINSIADPPTPPTVTRSAVWTPYNSAPKTFDVVVEGFTIGAAVNESTVRTVLSIMLPGGRP